MLNCAGSRIELRSPFSEVKSLLHYLLSKIFSMIGGMMVLVLVLRWFLLRKLFEKQKKK